MVQQITIDESALAAICTKHGIRKFSLFGSVLREDFHDDSDIEIVGEAAAQLSPEARDEILNLPWPAVISTPISMLTWIGFGRRCRPTGRSLSTSSGLIFPGQKTAGLVDANLNFAKLNEADLRGANIAGVS